LQYHGPLISITVPKGLSFDQAIKGGLFLYLNFWKLSASETITKLRARQTRKMKKRYDKKIEFKNSIMKYNNHINIYLREAHFPDNKRIELTAYRKFDRLVAFIVIHSKANDISAAKEKIVRLLGNALPVKAINGYLLNERT